MKKQKATELAQVQRFKVMDTELLRCERNTYLLGKALLGVLDFDLSDTPESQRRILAKIQVDLELCHKREIEGAKPLLGEYFIERAKISVEIARFSVRSRKELMPMVLSDISQAIGEIGSVWAKAQLMPTAFVVPKSEPRE